jgi:molybdopterin molybdotransferase
MPDVDRLDRPRAIVTGCVEPVGADREACPQAVGRRLAEALVARHAAPPCACSAMGGWAVRAAEAAPPARLRTGQVLCAGDLPGVALGPAEGAPILMGAPLPPGADAVVREERTREERGWVDLEGVRPGENVRPAGEDVPLGALALEAGVRLGARQLGLAAAVGAEDAVLRRPPRVAFLVTGDEVVLGRIPDSNGQALAVAIRALGAEPALERVGDDPAAIGRALAAALDSSDAVVTIGGVSVGARDLVPEAVAEVFARPALLRLAGAARLSRRVVRAPLAEPVAGRAARARFLWARLEDGGGVRPVERDAAQVKGPALADALPYVREGAGDLAAGAAVEAWLLEDDAA